MNRLFKTIALGLLLVGSYSAGAQVTATSDGQGEKVKITPRRSAHDAVFNIYLKGLPGVDTPNKFHNSGFKTGEEFLLPAGNYAYELRLNSNEDQSGTRDGMKLKGEDRKHDLAYKGHLNVKRGADKTLKVRTFSENGGFAILSGTYHLLSPDAKYGKLASADFANFKVFPGYSTSLLKANLYRTSEMSLPQGEEYYYGGTVAFLNGDFRIGGSLCDFADLGFLFSYSYTPEISKVLEESLFDEPFHYVDNDYDLFFGAELSTRIAVLNAMFRAGYRINRGDFNLYSLKDSAYHTVTFDSSGPIVSVSLRLGSTKSKGVNMIKLFYL